MQKEKDGTKLRSGDSPPLNAEEIYSNWLQRPRSVGAETPGSGSNASPDTEETKETT